MTAPELGTTGDPAALVPGDPVAVGRTAAALTSYGDVLYEAGAGLERIESPDGWSGPAAEQFRSVFDGEPARWREAGDCFHYAGAALDRHRTVLTWAQARAAEAVRLWADGVNATEHARGAAVPPLTDPGEPARQAAEDVLVRARDQLAAAGDDAAHVVGRARDMAPDARSWPEQVGDAAGDLGAGIVNAAASFGNAALNHPEMTFGLSAGAGLVAVGALGVGGGVGMSSTGVGAVAGVPLGGVSLAGMALGAGLAGVSGVALAAEANGDDAVEVVGTSSAEPAEPPMPWEDPAVREKIPDEWGDGQANKSGVGHRWLDPENPNRAGVRIDKGDPNVSQPTQHDDHVVVREGGKVIGRDGQPIPGAIKDYPEDAHIPLAEWKRWRTWNQP